MDEFNTALVVLRVWIGVVMLTHGIKHLRGREKTTRWLKSMGFRGADMQWIGMAFGEIVAGLFLALGAMTSIAAAGTASIMVVAYLTVHRPAGFWITARPDEGWEYVATILAGSIAIGLLGPGEWSVDSALGIAENLDGWLGFAIVAGGILAGIGQVAAFYRPKNNAID